MKNEELDSKNSIFINEAVIKTLEKITLECSTHSIYSQYNLIMNVLTGCLVKMMQLIDSSLREEFIELVNKNLKINLEKMKNDKL